MTRSEPAYSSTNVTGGTFIGSAVGQGNKVSNNTITVGGLDAQASIDDLRKTIAAACDDLVWATEDRDARAVVRYEISTIERELAKEQPRGTVVRSRWEQVSEVLSPLAAASGIVAEITDLITKIFGGS